MLESRLPGQRRWPSPLALSLCPMASSVSVEQVPSASNGPRRQLPNAGNAGEEGASESQRAIQNLWPLSPEDLDATTVEQKTCSSLSIYYVSLWMQVRPPVRRVFV